MVGITVSVATDSIDLVFMIGLVSVSNCYYSLYLRTFYFVNHLLACCIEGCCTQASVTFFFAYLHRSTRAEAAASCTLFGFVVRNFDFASAAEFPRSFC